jgi:hypothetical protein
VRNFESKISFIPLFQLNLTHSWSWALLEKLPIVQLLKNFPATHCGLLGICDSPNVIMIKREERLLAKYNQNGHRMFYICIHYERFQLIIHITVTTQRILSSDLLYMGVGLVIGFIRLFDTARDYNLQFTVTHTLLPTVTSPLLLLGSGFQRRTFPSLCFPGLSLALATGFSQLLNRISSLTNSLTDWLTQSLTNQL